MFDFDNHPVATIFKWIGVLMLISITLSVRPSLVRNIK